MTRKALNPIAAFLAAAVMFTLWNQTLAISSAGGAVAAVSLPQIA